MECDPPGHRPFKLDICHKWINGINWFFEWWRNFRIANIYWLGIVESFCGLFLIMGLLNILIRRMDERIELIFCMLIKVQEIYCNMFWVVLVKAGHGNLISEINGWISWFFACSSIVRKAKNYFNSYWVHMFNNGCDLSGPETRKYALSQE